MPDDAMSLTEHLAELRSRIIRAGLAVVIGALVIIAFYDDVYDFLAQPYDDLCDSKAEGFCSGRSLNAFSPTEGISVRIRVGHVRRHHRRTAGHPVAGLAVRRPGTRGEGEEVRDPVRVLVGHPVLRRAATLAYFSVGQALEFLIWWSGIEVNQVFAVEKYFSLVGLMIFAFGIGFLLPVLLVFLQLVGVVTPQTLLKGWRFAIVGIFVVAAVITPSGDPITLMTLSVPMIVLYFVAVRYRLARHSCNRRQRRSESPDRAPRPRRVDRRARRSQPDRFQLDAFDALDAGRNVVVAAPTGSGKTVVAEYGIAADRVDGRRSFYTAPIKALSNQKYRDLVAIHGDRRRRPADRRQLDQR